MKLAVLTAVLAVCGAAKLDRTYLPPASARTAGGSPGAIDAPHENAINNQGLGGFPKGSFTNDVQGVVVDAAAAGTRSSDPNDSGLGAPRQYYGNQDSKVGAAAFKIGGGFGQNHGNDHDEYVEGSADAFRTSSNRFGTLNSGNPHGHATASSFASHGSAQNQNFNAGFNSGQERPQASQERAANTVRFESDVGPENFNFVYETDNGIMAAENGVEANGIKAEGGYSYTGDDGQVYSISYTADEGGYQPHGDHLPTPPPIPEEILRSLEQNKRDEEAGIVDDGSYDAQKYNGGDYSKSDNNNGQYNQGSLGSHGSLASSSASFGGQSASGSFGNSGKFSHGTNNQALNVASANSFVGSSQNDNNNNQHTFSGHDTTDVQGVGSASNGFESHAQGQSNRNIYSKHQGTPGNQVAAASTNNFSTDQFQGQTGTHSSINQDYASQQPDTNQQQGISGFNKKSFGQQSSHSSGFTSQGQNNLHNQASASAEFNSNRGNVQNQVNNNENHQFSTFGTKDQQPNKNGYLPPLGNQQGSQQTFAQSSTNQAFSSASSNNRPQQQKQQFGQLHQGASQQSSLNNLNQRPDTEEEPTFVALNEKHTIASSGFGSSQSGGPSNIHTSNEQHITSSRFGSKPQSNQNNVDASKFGQGSTNSFTSVSPESSTGHGAITQSSSGFDHSTGFTQASNGENLLNSNRVSGNQQLHEASRPSSAFASSRFEGGFVSSQSKVNSPSRFSNSVTTTESATHFGSNDEHQVSNQHLHRPTQSQNVFESSQFGSGTTSSQSNINRGPTQSQNTFGASKFGSGTTSPQSNINRGPTQSQTAFGSSQFGSGTTSSQSNFNRGPTQAQSAFGSSQFGSGTTSSQSNINRGSTQAQSAFGSSQFGSGTTSSQSNINRGPTQAQSDFGLSQFGSSTTSSQSNINRGPTQAQSAFGSSQFGSGTTSSQSNSNRGPSNFNSPVTSTETNAFSSSQAAYSTDDNQGHLSINDNRFGSSTQSPHFNQHASASSLVVNSGSSKDDSYYYKQPAKPFGITANQFNSQNVNTGSEYDVPTQNSPSTSFQSQQSSQYQQITSNRFSANSPQPSPFSQKQNYHSSSSASFQSTPQISQPSQQYTGFSQQGIQKHTTAIPHPFTPLGKQPLTDTQKVQAPQQFGQFSGSTQQTSSRFTASQQPASPVGSASASSHSSFSNQGSHIPGPNAPSSHAESSASTQQYDGEIYEYTKPAQMLPVPNKDQDGSSTHVSSQSAVSQGFLPQGSVNQFSAQSVSGKGEVFSGQRKPPSFDSETGYHY